MDYLSAELAIRPWEGGGSPKNLTYLDFAAEPHDDRREEDDRVDEARRAVEDLGLRIVIDGEVESYGACKESKTKYVIGSSSPPNHEWFGGDKSDRKDRKQASNIPSIQTAIGSA